MNTIRINSFWNLFGSVLPIVIGLVSIPFLIKSLGTEKFGLLSIIWSLIGYFSIFDFGVGRALTQGVASQRDQNNGKVNYSFIGGGLFATIITGFFGGLLLASLSKFIAYDILNTSDFIKDELYESLIYTSIGIPFVTYTSGIKGIMEGYEKFKIINIIKAFQGVSNFIFPVLSILFFGDSLVYITQLILIIRIVTLACHYYILHNEIKLHKVHFHYKLNNLKKNISIYIFGAWMTLSNVLSSLMVTADRFIISYLLGASIVAFYTVPFDLAIRVLIIPAAFTTTLFPKFAQLNNFKFENLKNIYFDSRKKIFQIMFFLCLFMIVFSKLGLEIWINQEFSEKSWKILVVLSVGIFFNGIAQVPHTLLQGVGNVRITAILHLIEFFIYIPLLFALLNIYGVIGAAFTFLFRAFIDLLALNYFSNKFLTKKIT